MVIDSKITEKTDNYMHTLIVLYTPPAPFDTVSKMTRVKQLFGNGNIGELGAKAPLDRYLAIKFL